MSSEASHVGSNGHQDTTTSPPPPLRRVCNFYLAPTRRVTVDETAHDESVNIAETTTQSHSRLTKSLSRLADAVTTPLFRAGTASPPAPSVAIPNSATSAAACRSDSAPDCVWAYARRVCPGRFLETHVEGLYERVYYTGTVCESPQEATRDECAPLLPSVVPSDDKGHIMVVIYGVLREGSDCPLVRRRGCSLAPAVSAPNDKADLVSTRLAFPFLSSDLLDVASCGACTTAELLEPPRVPGTHAQHTTPFLDESSSRSSSSSTPAGDRVVLLWLCTYDGGLHRGQRCGRGTLTVYGQFTLTCLWAKDVPLVSSPPASLSPVVSSGEVAGSCVLIEHIITVWSNTSPTACAERHEATTLSTSAVCSEKEGGNSTAVQPPPSSSRSLASLHAQTHLGARYMGSLVLRTPEGAPLRLCSTPDVRQSECLHGTHWLLASEFVLDGFGELIRLGTSSRCHATRQYDVDDESNSEGSDVSDAEDKADVPHVTRPVQATDSRVKSSAKKSMASSSSRSACSSTVRRRRRYLAQSTRDCVSTPSATNSRGVRLLVRSYCGGWKLGKRDGFGVLIGEASSCTLSPSSCAGHASGGKLTSPGRGFGCTRGGGEPCTFLGQFANHHRSGAGVLEMDRSGVVVCGTWGPCGLLLPRVPHSLVYPGEPAYSLQGLLFLPPAPGDETAEGQLLASAAAIRGRDDDVSAPLFFDQCTLVQSAGAINGIWEPLFCQLDTVMGNLCVALQDERNALGPDDASDALKGAEDAVDEMHLILERVVSLPEWGDLLACFQRCFFGLYAPCTGLGNCRSGHAVLSQKQAHSDETDEESHTMLRFLSEQSQGGRPQACQDASSSSSSSSFPTLSWCSARLSALQTQMAQPDEVVWCIHDERLPLAGVAAQGEQTHPGRSSSARTLVRYRERTPHIRLNHAVRLLRAMATSLRLRALPLLSDRPWAADLLAASSVLGSEDTTLRIDTAALSGDDVAASVRATPGVRTAQALAEFSWSEAYRCVAPVLHILCGACVQTDVRQGCDRILEMDTRSGSRHPGGAGYTSVMWLSSLMTRADWLTVFDAAQVRRWRRDVALLSASEGYPAPSLPRLYAAISRCLCMPITFFIPPSSPGAMGAVAEPGSPSPTLTVRARTTEAEASLIRDFARVCAKPTWTPHVLCSPSSSSSSSRQVSIGSTRCGSLLMWNTATEVAAADFAADRGTQDAVGWSLSATVDVLVSLVHHAVSLFPHSVWCQQQWLTYAVVRAAAHVVRNERGNRGPQEKSRHKQSEDGREEDVAPVWNRARLPRASKEEGELTQSGFNPFSPLLQVQAILGGPDSQLPLPPLSTLLLRELLAHQHTRQEEQAVTATTAQALTKSQQQQQQQPRVNAFTSELAKLRPVLLTVLVRVACAVEALVSVYPAVTRQIVPTPALSSKHMLTTRGVPVVFSLQELSARCRFFLSPVASHMASQCGTTAPPLTFIRISRSGRERSVQIDVDAIRNGLAAEGHATTVQQLLLAQPAEAMELALSVGGWTNGSLALSTALSGDRRPQRHQRGGHVQVAAAATTTALNETKSRAMHAVSALSRMWLNGDQNQAGTRASTDPAAATSAWMPPALKASLCVPQSHSHSRVEATLLMRWVVGCVQQTLEASLPRSPCVYRRFVPAHKVETLSPLRPFEMASTDSRDWLRGVGVSEAEVWYMVLLILCFEELGWSVQLTVSLDTDPRGGAAEVETATEVPLARVVQGSTPAPPPRQSALFDSSSSSSSASSSSSNLCAASPRCSPPRPAEPSLGDARRPRSSVGGGGLFSGPEFCLSIGYNHSSQPTVPPSPANRDVVDVDVVGRACSVAMGVQGQVLEQACSAIARQC